MNKHLLTICLLVCCAGCSSSSRSECGLCWPVASAYELCWDACHTDNATWAERCE